MGDNLFEGFFVVMFAIGVVSFLWLAIAGLVSRHRDHWMAKERWADEHGDEDPNKVKLHGGPSWSWTGPGPGF
ncbi:hypothetical protein GCM10009633_25640 [Janibacter melonis]|uniref:hypothetical protein n=1 Tax=Janibacter melonis TaxID=262209 RepID=UPI001E4DFD80|nr:hypothetical protein [Janibacter melonis]MCB5992828.1 hypothetical protein [Janibacter melonis]